MNSEQSYYYILGGIIALGLYYVITQWAHQIAKRNRYLEAQINLLSKIAEKQGVSLEEINKIVGAAEKKHEPLS
jgi:chromosome segregation and condensation protein ScpB